MTAATPSKLSELADLIQNLRLRHLHGALIDFLKSHGLKPGRQWKTIKAEIERVEQTDVWKGLEGQLQDWLRDAIMLSHKRIYVLTTDQFDPTVLGAIPGPGMRTDYLAGIPPIRPEKVQNQPEKPSYYLESINKNRATIFSFVTSRPVKKTEDVSVESLTDEGRLQYRNADLVAKFKLLLRSYDFIIKLDGKAYLLLDIPDGYESGAVEADTLLYQLKISELAGISPSDTFENLFPAVDSIYSDQAEGAINALGFKSDGEAEIVGRFSVDSDDDYRQQKFHKEGAKNAEVTPYKLAVKWPSHHDRPRIELPGQLSMVMTGSAASNGGSVIALRYMKTITGMKWDGFFFAVDRVLQHLTRAAAASAQAAVVVQTATTPQIGTTLPSSVSAQALSPPLTTSQVQAATASQAAVASSSLAQASAHVAVPLKASRTAAAPKTRSANSKPATVKPAAKKPAAFVQVATAPVPAPAQPPIALEAVVTMAAPAAAQGEGATSAPVAAASALAVPQTVPTIATPAAAQGEAATSAPVAAASTLAVPQTVPTIATPAAAPATVPSQPRADEPMHAEKQAVVTRQPTTESVMGGQDTTTELGMKTSTEPSAASAVGSEQDAAAVPASEQITDVLAIKPPIAPLVAQQAAISQVGETEETDGR